MMSKDCVKIIQRMDIIVRMPKQSHATTVQNDEITLMH